MEMSVWLNKVFGRRNGNGFELERLEGNTRNYPEQLHSLLSRMVANVYSSPEMICLPRLDVNKQIWFYLLASSSEQIAEVRGLIFSVLGSAYSYIDPVVHVKPIDGLETALLSKYSSGFVRINVPKSLNADKEKVYWVFNTLNEFVARYHSRPSVTQYRYRPVGRVLRDFFSAASVGDFEQGEACIAELRDKSQVSAQNLLFLEIQLYASANKWQYVTRHPKIEDVVNGRLPRRIVVLILRALTFTTSLPDLVETDSPESVTEILRPFSALFYRDLDIREVEPGDAVLKVWFIGAMAFGNRRSESIIDGQLDAGWIKKIRIWAGFTDTDSGNEAIYTLNKLLSAEQNVENLIRLIQLGMESSKEQVVDIVQAIDLYPLNVMEEVRANALLWNILEAFRKESAGALISGWNEFIDKALSGEEDDKLRQLAEENSHMWPASSWDEARWNEGLEGQLQNSNLIRNILPILNSWFEENSIELTSQTELQLMILLATDEVYSIADLNIFVDLLSGFLRGSHTDSEYSECLDSLEILWNKVECVKAVPKYLDLIEQLLDLPCANRDTLIDYWNGIQTSLLELWQRLPLHLQILTRQISIEITGTADHLPTDTETDYRDKQDEYVNLSGKRLAIYTLTEGAAKRAENIIQSMFPDLEIKLNHDKKATDSLVNLAKTSDYFIFASKSAAHQAFYPVTRFREDIIYPSGKGSSSMVNHFLEAVQNTR